MHFHGDPCTETLWRALGQMALTTLASWPAAYSHCIHTEVGGKGANTYFKNNSSRIFSCIRGVCEYRHHMYSRKNEDSSRIVSRMYWLCAGGSCDMSAASYDDNVSSIEHMLTKCQLEATINSCNKLVTFSERALLS